MIYACRRGGRGYLAGNRQLTCTTPESSGLERPYRFDGESDGDPEILNRVRMLRFGPPLCAAALCTLVEIAHLVTCVTEWLCALF
jgi:hypothetical protein